ncbi:hypothetical protein MXL46_11705 [Heyndrickxia sporothermodurans]|uniref:hypothetical protein n=1 Tax=Heyndrickxia sporothermodurans TaxID=46224 RepID=UPI002DBE8065|nr:hypothetical protein [Heyndrickxia sporothermodurans]MEB6549751.1 hypothetical protein [Heyndrickxia sporothermodurans]
MSIIEIKQKQLKEVRELYHDWQYALLDPSYQKEFNENPSETPCLHALEAAYAVKVATLLDLQFVTKEEIANIEMKVDEEFKRNIETYRLQQFMVEVKGEGEEAEQYKIIRFDEPYVNDHEAVNEAIQNFIQKKYIHNSKFIKDMITAGKTQAVAELSARVVEVQRVKPIETK